MGKVYEGWDLNLERRVAVKKLREDLGEDPRELERFLSEAKTVAGLRHPNIVSVHEVLREEKDVFIVFEYIEGGTLGDLISRQGRLKPAECLQVAKPVCEALDHAHAQGVIHRDLKPANIMIEKGVVKVMDFGIARRTADPGGHTRTSMVFGTPAYMAPEALYGEVSREADLYSLGVCLYQMLTGRLPFDGPGLAQDKMDSRFAPASTYLSGQPGLDAFFRRALDPKREGRFHSGTEMAAALSGALAS